ncbi:hypothetical protein Bpfe_027350 [Biomphalaria pfeifferi]|uniref:UBX domain-containing protein n=1 Tax=Biomphalaria pfeifferi TaxID=112525 RepID=A0AAD8AVN4_BIOPF|nr:hypothetical protein Bpfe_027350 [Biomphalaria pfeifferi]
MASEAGSLDDIVVTLMSMGFEINDCQEAITNGKLTVQSAIDWILAGKPGNVAVTQKSLVLNKPMPNQLGGGSSNPFVPTNVSALTPASDTNMESSSSEVMGVDASDDTIVSRCHLSEKQQQIKLNFQEKERLEAKRLASEEKKRKKNERERILKEIQEDREKVKLIKQSKLDTPSSASEVPQLNIAVREPADGQEDQNTTTSIQVRLPSGQMFRQSFSVQSTLYNVWESVCAQLNTAIIAYCGFIQPFPRKEYSRDEMRHTLKALGLVPSGSLVLKKKDADQATPPDPSTMQSPIIMRALAQLGDEREEAEEEEVVDRPPPFNWGRVLRPNRDEPMDVGLDDNEGQLNILDQFRGVAAHPVGGVHPIVGNHRFEGFGNRLVPEGVPGDDNRHLNRRAPEMAAEAAENRSAQNQPSTSQSFQRSSFTEHFFNVRSLQDMSMSVLSRRFTDPRNPIYSISGLSEEILQKFLAYLKKEGLLKPKILHMLPSYLLKLTLDFYPYTTNELLYAARIFVNLHTLSLNSCTLITDSGLIAIKGMKSLKVLNLSGCSQITNSCFAFIQELKQLQTLNLEGTGVTDPGIIQFSESETAVQLAHLDLGRTSITHEIFPSLQKMKMLKSLYMKNTRISSLAGLETVTSLENLDISETNIVTDCILCLTRLPGLSHLSLTGTQDVNGDRALAYLKDMKLTALYLPCRSTTSDAGFQLTSLDLTNYINIGDPSMFYIGQMISLKKLLLTNTKISDEGMQHLTKLVNLEVLYLDRTLVSNAGAAIIVNFKHLNELSLSATSITSDFVKQGSLNQCIYLTKLNLSRTIIGDKGIHNLKLPNLLMLNLDCTRVHPSSISIIESHCPNVKSVTIANLAALNEDEEN